MSHQEVIYKIPYDCNVICVSQRNVNKKLEYVSNSTKKTGSISVISNHKLTLDHNSKWNEVKILDNEQSYNKRLISKMVHIKKKLNGLIKQSDTKSLPNSYLPILQASLP